MGPLASSPGPRASRSSSSSSSELGEASLSPSLPQGSRAPRMVTPDSWEVSRVMATHHACVHTTHTGTRTEAHTYVIHAETCGKQRS